MPTKTYELTTKGQFTATLAIEGLAPPCNTNHTYTYQVEATVGSMHLQLPGFLIDYRDLQHQLTELLQTLDGQYLNDLPSFKDHAPTTEHLAEWLCQTLQAKLPDDTTVLRVQLSTSPECTITYHANS